LADRVGVYVELHVEQGRALDLVDRPLAVASAIWPHGRWRFSFCGEANHAGATRLVDRRDPMLTFATSVHHARARAAAHQAVATFGKVAVTPNGANAIPSRIDAWLDARAADEATLRALVADIAADAATAADGDRTELTVDAESVSPAVIFPDNPRARIQQALAALGDVPVLPTAAGHDAGVLSATVPTAMLFVRNPTGVSHSPDEYAELADCRTGAEALAKVMADWVTG
jgi:beta-ureidopropionase / N-carbamoyl-L-amino-acid hydrolase